MSENSNSTEYTAQEIQETLDSLQISFTSSNNDDKKKALETLEFLSKIKNYIGKNVVHHVRIVYLTLKDDTILKSKNNLLI